MIHVVFNVNTSLFILHYRHQETSLMDSDSRSSLTWDSSSCFWNTWLNLTVITVTLMTCSSWLCWVVCCWFRPCSPGQCCWGPAPCCHCHSHHSPLTQTCVSPVSGQCSTLLQLWSAPPAVSPLWYQPVWTPSLLSPRWPGVCTLSPPRCQCCCWPREPRWGCSWWFWSRSCLICCNPCPGYPCPPELWPANIILVLSVVNTKYFLFHKTLSTVNWIISLNFSKKHRQKLLLIAMRGYMRFWKI